MDTEKCKVLLKAVDLGSFTKAAEELGYTPSGVTHMMNALEEDLGVTLL
ncbi:MAG: LysR family transcriptional regulator, partial [Clostridia bacterium]|nr:LysR family transcriptional regulator [Clostridia bacterium]